MNAVDVINFLVPKGSYSKQTVSFGNIERLAMDVYSPKEKQQKAPIVFVFGGAWRSGKKEDFEFVAQALVSLGHPVIIPNYRLYPSVRFPTFIEDVADAIAYLDKNAQELLNQPLKDYILMGHSSGAHATSLLAVEQGYLKERKVNAELIALIAMSGPYDLPLDDPEVTDVFKDVKDSRANPIEVLRSRAEASMPATLLLHGTNDRRVIPRHTKTFAEVLNNFDHDVTTRLYRGMNHTRIIGSLAAPLRFLGESYQDIQEFLLTLEEEI